MAATPGCGRRSIAGDELVWLARILVRCGMPSVSIEPSPIPNRPFFRPCPASIAIIGSKGEFTGSESGPFTSLNLVQYAVHFLLDPSLIHCSSAGLDRSSSFGLRVSLKASKGVISLPVFNFYKWKQKEELMTHGYRIICMENNKRIFTLFCTTPIRVRLP